MLPSGNLSVPASSSFYTAFFGSNTGHAFNDAVDKPFDRMTARTRKRPVARGDITRCTALAFAALNLSGLILVIFAFSPRGTERYMLPNLAAVVYYPFAKRHTHYAQVVLGFCLSYSVFIGSLSMKHEPFSWQFFKLSARDGRSHPDIMHTTFGDAHIDLGILSLFLAILCWTVISDTVYAHQDLEDDIHLELKSMAVLLRDRTKPVLSVFLAAMVISLGVCGSYYSFGILYHILSLAGSLVILGNLLVKVDLKDSSSCWWWFCTGFWGVYVCLAGSLSSEYYLVA